MATKKKAAKKAGGKAKAKRASKRSFGCPGVHTEIHGKKLCIKIDRRDRCTVVIRCRGCTAAEALECVWNGTSWDCTANAAHSDQ